MRCFPTLSVPLLSSELRVRFFYLLGCLPGKLAPTSGHSLAGRLVPHGGVDLAHWRFPIGHVDLGQLDATGHPELAGQLALGRCLGSTEKRFQIYILGGTDPSTTPQSRSIGVEWVAEKLDMVYSVLVV